MIVSTLLDFLNISVSIIKKFTFCKNSKCEDFGNAVQDAFHSFLANPTNYIERELTIETCE